MSDQPPGAMPPPPASPPPPLGGQPSPGANVGQAVSWAFDRFKAFPAQFIGLAAVVTVIQFVGQIGSRSLMNVVDDCSGATTQGQVAACTAALGATAFVSIGLSLVLAVIAFLAQIGVQRAAIRSTQGQPPSFSQMLTTEHLGQYLLFYLLFFLACLVGLLACCVGILVVLFLFQLGPYYILDKGVNAIDAFKLSYRAVTKNIGPALIMTILAAVVSILGGVLFGLLTLVTLPFACLFTAHMYRQFNHEAIVAPTTQT